MAFLDKRLKWFEWTGMLSILVGVILAALAQKLDQRDDEASVSGHFLLGVIFLLVANFANSVEAITAEVILKVCLLERWSQISSGNSNTTSVYLVC